MRPAVVAECELVALLQKIAQADAPPSHMPLRLVRRFSQFLADQFNHFCERRSAQTEHPLHNTHLFCDAILVLPSIRRCLGYPWLYGEHMTGHECDAPPRADPALAANFLADPTCFGFFENLDDLRLGKSGFPHRSLQGRVCQKSQLFAESILEAYTKRAEGLCGPRRGGCWVPP
jgi:hypothetical protein